VRSCSQPDAPKDGEYEGAGLPRPHSDLSPTGISFRDIIRCIIARGLSGESPVLAPLALKLRALKRLLHYMYERPWAALGIVSGTFGRATAVTLVYAIFWELRRHMPNSPITLGEVECALSSADCWRALAERLKGGGLTLNCQAPEGLEDG